jgi:RNA polymerase sigma-70 factor (ECF subfamily)
MCESSRDRLDELARHHYQHILRFLYRLTHSEPDAQDLAQEVFMRLLTALDAGHTIDDPLGYLLKSAYRAFLASQAHLGAAAKALEGYEHRPEGLPPEQAALEREAIGRLHSALDELPRNQRDVLVLVVVKGMTYAEAARVLGTSAKTVNVWRTRALRRLREMVGLRAFW